MTVAARRSRCSRPVDETKAVGGGPGRAGARRATSSCWSASWVPARRRSRRASPAASASNEPVTSPTFTLVHDVRGPPAHAPRRRLPPRADGRGGRPRPRRAARRRTASRSSSGATSSRRPVRGRPPGGAPHASATATTTATSSCAAGGPALGGAGWRAVGRGRGGLAMLILGIESATEQVGLRHRRPRGRARACSRSPGAGATPRRSTPAIEFVLPSHRHRPRRDQRRRRRHRPGPVHRACGSGIATGQGHRPRAAGADDRHLQPRPAGLPAAPRHRMIVTVIDARRGELFYAFYRQVPGGVQRLGDLPASARPTTSWPTCCAPATSSCCVGDGALRYRDAARARCRGLEFAEQWLAHPSAAPARAAGPRPRRCARTG